MENSKGSLMYIVIRSMIRERARFRMNMKSRMGVGKGTMSNEIITMTNSATLLFKNLRFMLAHILFPKVVYEGQNFSYGSVETLRYFAVQLNRVIKGAG